MLDEWLEVRAFRLASELQMIQHRASAFKASDGASALARCNHPGQLVRTIDPDPAGTRYPSNAKAKLEYPRVGVKM